MYSQNLSSVTDLIHHWLTQQEGLDWLEQKRTQIAQGAPARVFFTAFSAVPRYTGKQDLQLTQQDWQAIVNYLSRLVPRTLEYRSSSADAISSVFARG